MPDPSPNPLIFTDLDGTLLDHHTYGYEPAMPVLRKLAGLGIPVIANTSKTRSEWLHLAAELGNRDAFVVENGSAVYFPDGTCEVFGERREKILGLLAGLRSRHPFEGYADWSVEEIAEKTGLDIGSARRSADREFSEPLIWSGTEEEMATFREEVEAAGLSTLQGGRFLHVLGRTDKGRAVDLMHSTAFSPVIALGDSENDIAMLRAADIGVVIASPTGRRLGFESQNRIIRSTLEGPEGWAEVMEPLLDSILTDTPNH